MHTYTLRPLLIAATSHKVGEGVAVWPFVWPGLRTGKGWASTIGSSACQPLQARTNAQRPLRIKGQRTVRAALLAVQRTLVDYLLQQ